ncbi:Uncharacterised protein [Mycobacteroides abscessus subsp. abscessus]|nr:Uncharacterised protein [Mycobacteroides abscessus subsp. abscessus]
MTTSTPSNVPDSSWSYRSFSAATRSVFGRHWISDTSLSRTLSESISSAAHGSTLSPVLTSSQRRGAPDTASGNRCCCHSIASRRLFSS